MIIYIHALLPKKWFVIRQFKKNNFDICAIETQPNSQLVEAYQTFGLKPIPAFGHISFGVSFFCIDMMV